MAAKAKEAPVDDKEAKEGKGDGKEEAKEGKGEEKTSQKKGSLEESVDPKAKLKFGDYVVQVHIIECRDLKGRGFSDMSDPLAVVQCMGQTQHTKICKKQLNPVFDQVLVFEFRDLYPDQVERSKVTISIKDANTLRKDVLIGLYEFDLSTVYYQKNHEVYRQWAALTDVSDEHEGIQGYVKCSVVVLGPDDEQYTHSAADADDEESSMMAVLMPPHIEQTGKLLKIRAYEVEGLPAMDDGVFGSKCDPYILVEFAGIEIKTKHFSGQNALMNQEIHVPVMEPIMSTKLRVSVYDWDAGSSDDRIATMQFDYNDIKESEPDAAWGDSKAYQFVQIQDIDINGVKDIDKLRERKDAKTGDGKKPASGVASAGAVVKKLGKPTWYNLYGAPEGKQIDKISSAMNRGYTRGTFYRGRALLGFRTEEATDPKMATSDCPPLLADQRPPEEKYVIQFDLYEGSEIPDKGDMEVQVCIGTNMEKSASLSVKDGRCHWYAPFKDLVSTWPRDLKQVPDVFVYLARKSKRMSFCRFTFESLVLKGWRAPPEWVILQEDPALDALDEDEFPGALLFSIRAGLARDLPAAVHPLARPLAAENMPDEYEDEVVMIEAPKGEAKAPPPKAAPKPVSKIGRLTLTVVEGTSLPAMDSNGSSDPFCKIKVGALREYKTKTVNKSLNPTWNECLAWDNMSIETPITITVLDHDTVGDDKIGEFEIDLRREQIESKIPFGTTFSRDTWFLVSSKYPSASVRCKIHFLYLSVEEAKVQEAKEEAKAAASFFTRKVKKEKKAPAGGELGRPAPAQYQLRVHLYQARNLPSADPNGLADPYVVVRCCGKVVKFARQDETLNPQWYQSLPLLVMLPTPLVFAPPIQIMVMDYDTVSKDDPMGRFYIPMPQIAAMNPIRDKIKPEWFSLNTWENKPVPDARVLMSFQLIPQQDAHNLPMPVIRPPTIPMTIEVTTLGLRALSSVLGVHKTFLDFEVPGGKRFRTKPSKLPTPRNPNFCQVLKIPIDLPLDKIFAPSLSIEVRDILFGGLIKRIIAANGLDIGQFMEQDAKDPERWVITNKRINLVSDAELEKEIESDRESAFKAKVASELKKATELEAQRQAQEDAEKERIKAAAAIGAAGRVSIAIAGESKRGEGEGLGLGGSPPASPRTLGGAADGTGKGGADSAPLLGGLPDSSAEVKVDIPPLLSPLSSPRGSKDETYGLGLSIGAKRVEKEKQPLLSKPKEVDSKTPVTDEFKQQTLDRGARWDADGPQEAEDPEADVPPYMRGRLVVDDELEDNMQIAPFHKIDLFTGIKAGAGLFDQKYRKSGQFKGLIRLIDSNTEKAELNVKELLQPKDLFLRLYILRGHKLSPKDDDGLSDPYLIVRLGKQVINLRDKRIENTLNPEFYEAIEIPVTIPGDSDLEITVMDWDGIGDDFIGSTHIDIEDRWFCKEWRKLPMKPVELRTLKSRSSNFSQGKLEMWMELLPPLVAKKTPLTVIKPPPPQQFELRVINWGCLDVPIHDELTGQNDLYVTCALSTPGAKPQSSDTHLRAKNGKGNFNWRYKFPISLPCQTWPRLRFQIWDKDFFSPNDAICETILPIKGLCKRAMKRKDRVKVYMKGSDKFWLENLKHPNVPAAQGRLQISIELLPVEIAAQLGAGLGRSDPNANPFLPPPEGRVNWSLFHPFDMLKEILGPTLYRKICFACFFVLFIAACVFMAPMISSNLVAKIITG